MIKKYKLKNKKILLVIVILLALSIGVTYAYFTSEDVFENKFNAMRYDVSIEEEFYNTWGTKRVKFRNNDSAAVVLRVSYNELWSESEENVEINDTQNIHANKVCHYGLVEMNGEKRYTLNNKINGNDVVEKKWTEGWNSFTKGTDGWYYYNKILDSSDEIQILDSINLKEDVINNSDCELEYRNFGYELSFNYEVIQADKNAISEIWGYDVNISEGNIGWTF